MIRQLIISWLLATLSLAAAMPDDLLRFPNGEQLQCKFEGVKEGEKLFGNEMILTFEKSNNLLDASDTEF